jgi:hypothetical protein
MENGTESKQIVPPAQAAEASAGPVHGNSERAQVRKKVDDLLKAHEQKTETARAEAAAKAKAEAEAKAQEEAKTAGLLEGESWDAIYKGQPPEVQRAMDEVRKSTTRQAQALAAERKKLEAQTRALADSGLLETLAADAGKVPEEFDPFNPEHMKQLIEAKVAERLRQVVEPLHKQTQQAQAAAEYEAFKTSHPDLTADPEVKAAVVSALKADPNLRLEAAYWMVKGQRASAAEAAAAKSAEVRRRAAQRAAGVVDRGRRPGEPVLTDDMRKMSGPDLYEHLLKQKK